jgi:hypothetical protein
MTLSAAVDLLLYICCDTAKSKAIQHIVQSSKAGSTKQQFAGGNDVSNECP